MKGLYSAWQEWWQRRAILRDIRRRQGDQRERDRFVVRDLLEEALAATELNDNHKATAIWTSTRERFPAEIRKSPLALGLLLKLKLYDEAQVLMREGRKKHPTEVFFATGLASVALKRGDYDAAAEHYAAVRRQFPGVWVGYTLGAQALIASDRLEEAEAVAEQAMKKFPEEIAGFLEYARLAVHREDWTEAMRRWTIIQDRFKDRVFGALGRAQALVKLGRYDEADEVITAARFRFSSDSGLLAESARCAQARGDVPEAVKRWKRRIERAPMEAYGYYDAARAFKGMGELVEAEAILQAAIERFPVKQAQ
jgi:tetratricopeptide (TPR) repeat protein